MTSSLLVGLDVGSVRIGVATVRGDVRIAQPLTTLANRPEIYDDIIAVVAEQAATGIVVGWPRGLDGQETAQTRFVEDFVAGLRQRTDLPLHLQDEALTSHKAEEELERCGRPYDKAEVDALAATYILDDFVRDQEAAAGLPAQPADGGLGSSDV